MLQNYLSSRAVIGKRRDTGFSPCAEGSFFIENMRTLEDGSAVLREGYSYSCTLPAPPRALLEGTGSEHGKVYAVAGNGFYLFDPYTGDCVRLATVKTSTGDAAILRCGGRIYVLDGEELWKYDSVLGLTAEAGYVPLYGKGWNPLSRGSVYEPMNLLTRRIRINYRISAPTLRLVTGVILASVDSFELNGKLLTAADAVQWSLDAGGGFITVTELNAGDVVNIFATVAEGTVDRTAVTSCTAAVSFSDGEATRICCYDGLDPSAVCVSAPTDRAADGSASKGELYFPTDGRVTVGDGGGSVTALCRCGGNILLFTEKETYRLECGSSRTPSADLVDGSSGVSRHGCAAGIPGGAVSVFGDGIYYRKAGKADGNSSGGAAERILADASGYYRVGAVSCVHVFGDEVWFCDPDDKRGRALIYNSQNGSCCCFTHIYADRLFRAGGYVCFTRGSDIYRFDPALIFDVESDENGKEQPEPIKGFIESPFIDFDLPERLKRMHCVSLDCRGGDAVLTLIADTGKMSHSVFRDGRCTAEPYLHGKRRTAAARGNTGAFHSIKYRISTADTRRPRIFGVTLAVKK